MELTSALDHAREHPGGVLVTLKADGRPQMSNIRHLVGDDGAIRISVTSDRAKTANARRDPRVSLYVGREDFGAYVVIEGIATLTPPAEAPDDATADAMVQYYRDAAGEHPNWDEYRQAMVDDGRVLLTLQPERAYGFWM
jgi:PPOX class probable F420-dependent enzyme